MSRSAPTASGHVVWFTERDADDRIGYCRVPAGRLGVRLRVGTLPRLSRAGIREPSPTRAGLHARGEQGRRSSCPARVPRPPRPAHLPLHLDGQRRELLGTVSTGRVTSELSGHGAFINSGDIVLGVFGSSSRRMRSVPGTTTTTDPRPAGACFDRVGGAGPGACNAGGLRGQRPQRRRVPGVHRSGNRRHHGGRAQTTRRRAELGARPRSSRAPEGNNEETHPRVRRPRRLPHIPLRRTRRHSGGPPQVRRDHEHLRRRHVSSRVRARSTTTASASSYHSQDAAGRLHVVWRTLYYGNRLRYTPLRRRRRDLHAPPANLATARDLPGPARRGQVRRGPGFAVWRSSGSAIRVVRIDPQPEPAGPGGPGPGGPGGP